MKSFYCVLSALFCIICVIYKVNAANTNVSVALCYADNPPIAALSKFNWVVVDSDAQFDLKKASSNSNTIWLSYVSVGEVTSDRSYYKKIPKSWFMGENTDWDASIINQTVSGWPDFFINTMTAPLWQRGFKGFFLDTLDSYQLVADTDKQRNGLANVILTLKSKFPDAILILNRGFEIMPSVHQAANMVAFESLFSGWDQGQKKIVPVSNQERKELLQLSRQIQNKYGLPVLAIDYYLPKNTTAAKSIAKQIQGQGIISYVTDPDLQTVGYGPPNMN